MVTAGRPGRKHAAAMRQNLQRKITLGLLLPAMVGVLLNSDDRRFDGCAQVSLCDLSQGADHAKSAAGA